MVPPVAYVVYAPPAPTPTNQLFGPPSVGVLVSKRSEGLSQSMGQEHRPGTNRRRRPLSASRQWTGARSRSELGHGSREQLHRGASGFSIAGSNDGGRYHGGRGANTVGFGVSGSSLSVSASVADLTSRMAREAAAGHTARYHEVAPRAVPRIEAPASRPEACARNARDLDGRAFGELSHELWPRSGSAASLAGRRDERSHDDFGGDRGGGRGRGSRVGLDRSAGDNGMRAGGKSSTMTSGGMPIRPIYNHQRWAGVVGGAHSYDSIGSGASARGYHWRHDDDGEPDHGGRDWEGAQADATGMAGKRQSRVSRRWHGGFGGPFWLEPADRDTDAVAQL
jgi:hypothetical protein